MAANLQIAAWASAAVLTLGGAVALAQTAQPRVPQEGVSDVGSFEAVPYAPLGRVLLRAEDKYARELHALRVKQYAEREALLRSLVRR